MHLLAAALRARHPHLPSVVRKDCDYRPKVAWTSRFSTGLGNVAMIDVTSV